jgi:hypothetical protein
MKRNGGSQYRARRSLQSILRECVTSCAWCGEVIYWLERIPADVLLNATHNYATVRVNGGAKKVALATVDHYFERSHGGTNELRNLIPACAKCNSERSQPPPSGRYKTCLECGRPKTGGARRRCAACVDRAREIYLKAKGLWDEQRKTKALAEART